MKGNIWITGNRIVYVGKEIPALSEGAEIIDAIGKKIVPGYIEPHVHPFQLYNPRTFADYAGRLGTTTFISHNLTFVLALDNETSFALLDELNELPFSFYWWARFDSQTVLQREKELFNEASIEEWLQRPDVLLGSELTGWPKLLAGDPQMRGATKAAKVAGKKVEGHYPGAAERTLARMKLLGTDGDQESVTIEDVEARLLHGYAVTLRHSSIRPDLPHLLKGIAGGMVIIENEEVIAELPLLINGGLSAKPVEELKLKAELTKHGHKHGGAVCTFLFLLSTHLPYVRIRQVGIFDVMKNKVLIPVTER